MSIGIRAEPDLGKDTLLWLAGLLEGEGSFMPGPPSKPNAPRIGIQMVDEDVVARAAKAFGVSHVKSASRSAAWQVPYSAQLRGEAAVTLMRALRPMMGMRRQAQIDRAIASWKPQIHKVQPKDEGRILELLAEGRSYRAIGRLTGFSYTTVGNVAARNKGP